MGTTEDFYLVEMKKEDKVMYVSQEQVAGYIDRGWKVFKTVDTKGGK